METLGSFVGKSSGQLERLGDPSFSALRVSHIFGGQDSCGASAVRGHSRSETDVTDDWVIRCGSCIPLRRAVRAGIAYPVLRLRTLGRAPGNAPQLAPATKAV